ncbi:MAG: YheC/YheD family protein [Alicyclobacillaceae bacterium]|nr:YheC/YheD family protein [Alicyclobacillaceae bacterium]
MKLAVLLWQKGGEPVGNVKLYRELAAVGRTKGWKVGVITPRALLQDPPRQYVWDGAGWRTVGFHGADAVYNRIPHRRLEATRDFRAAVRFLEDRGLPMWNPGFFLKDQILQSWLSHESLARHIPETATWTGLETLADHQHPWILKPCDGRAGEGIVRIERIGPDKFQWKWQREKRTGTGQGDELACHKFVRKWARGQHYVVQRWIPLALWHGKPFDFRLLWQKDADGRWRHRGVGVRVAGPRALTTHVPWGGQIAEPKQVLREVFGSRSGDLFEQAIATANTAVERLDGEFGGRCGEMSIDLGCDRNGMLWLFEANAKPMRFDEPSIHAAYLRGVFETALWAARRTTGSARLPSANRQSGFGRC